MSIRLRLLFLILTIINRCKYTSSNVVYVSRRSHSFPLKHSFVCPRRNKELCNKSSIRILKTRSPLYWSKQNMRALCANINELNLISLHEDEQTLNSTERLAFLLKGISIHRGFEIHDRLVNKYPRLLFSVQKLSQIRKGYAKRDK